MAHTCSIVRAELLKKINSFWSTDGPSGMSSKVEIKLPPSFSSLSRDIAQSHLDIVSLWIRGTARGVYFYLWLAHSCRVSHRDLQRGKLIVTLKTLSLLFSLPCCLRSKRRKHGVTRSSAAVDARTGTSIRHSARSSRLCGQKEEGTTMNVFTDTPVCLMSDLRVHLHCLSLYIKLQKGLKCIFVCASFYAGLVSALMSLYHLIWFIWTSEWIHFYNNDRNTRGKDGFGFNYQPNYARWVSTSVSSSALFPFLSGVKTQRPNNTPGKIKSIVEANLSRRPSMSCWFWRELFLCFMTGHSVWGVFAFQSLRV